jgi:serpin B
MRKTLLLILILGVMLLVAACAGEPGTTGTIEEPKPSVPSKSTLPKADDTGATPEGISSTVEANNLFALDLYSELSAGHENVFFSPYSIFTALAMTYEGARGQTAQEIRAVFHLLEDDHQRRSSIAAGYNRLNRQDAQHELHTANALWSQKDYQLLDEYTSTIEKYYGGKVTTVDFRNAVEEARKTINSWVEGQTNDRIKDLLPQGSLDASTLLVLTNAIYFKGDWVKSFEENGTRDEYFHIDKDEKVKVPMMRQTGAEAVFNYAETEELQILEMLYAGEELSMLVLLPKEGLNLKALEESLTLDKLNEWRCALEEQRGDKPREQRVDVFMPKFTFKSKHILNETLKEMGMPTAFAPGAADFSGISGKKDLFIGLVAHQAFVNVDEEGTEAAAATAVVIREVAITEPATVPVFHANRPFVFLIQERETGCILFLGKVVNPVQE